MQNDSSGVAIFLVMIGFVYFLPTSIAVARGHEYRWPIFALNLAGGWTGLLWIAAFVWAVYPSNKTLVDPFVGNATGKGHRNAGDALGEMDFGRERGYHATGRQWQNHGTSGKKIENFRGSIDLSAKFSALEQLKNLKDQNVLSEEEFEQQKRSILSLNCVENEYQFPMPQGQSAISMPLDEVPRDAQRQGNNE